MHIVDQYIYIGVEYPRMSHKYQYIQGSKKHDLITQVIAKITVPIPGSDFDKHYLPAADYLRSICKSHYRSLGSSGSPKRNSITVEPRQLSMVITLELPNPLTVDQVKKRLRI